MPAGTDEAAAEKDIGHGRHMRTRREKNGERERVQREVKQTD